MEATHVLERVKVSKIQLQLTTETTHFCRAMLSWWKKKGVKGKQKGVEGKQKGVEGKQKGMEGKQKVRLELYTKQNNKTNMLRWFPRLNQYNSRLHENCDPDAAFGPSHNRPWLSS